MRRTNPWQPWPSILLTDMPNHTQCRICGTTLPAPFLDLGSMPLANALLSSPAEAAGEASYPLAVAACPTCGLVQLNYVVPAEQLYRNYLYVSATSDAVRTHADWLADEFLRRYGWQPTDRLMEVASNDGTVLKAFQRRGLRVLGIEPALNIAVMAEADGVPTVPEFFNAATAKTIVAKHGRAAGILARHVFAHVDNVHDFLEGVSTLLADDGVLAIEVPYLGNLLRHGEFDTIYHEHLSYFSLQPLLRLFGDHGLMLADVDSIALHGGSMVLHVRRRGRGAVSQRLERMIQEERDSRFTDGDNLRRFAQTVYAWREQFTGLIHQLQQEGARLIGYGAAAKATVLLNFCPSSAKALTCVLDRSPLKHGRYMPGVHIPVKPVEDWRRSGATHLVVLAWNFADEIIRQMQPFAQGGGQFVIPIPQPRVVGSGAETALEGKRARP